MELRGVVDLPLHDGYVPTWLFKRMRRLTTVVFKVLLDEFGVEKLFERLSNPLWFQALNNVIGMDWNSSGSTTVTCAVIKLVLNNELRGYGVRVVGGKGVLSREVPRELRYRAPELGLSEEDVDYLIKVSRLVAKVDTAAVQSGYTLYHHVLLFDGEGRWLVIQQGMRTDVKLARRYHWYHGSVNKLFTDDPKEKVVALRFHEGVLNLVHRDSARCRETILDLVCNEPVVRTMRYLRYVKSTIKAHSSMKSGLCTLDEFIGTSNTFSKELPQIGTTIYYRLPGDEYVEKVLRKVKECNVESFDDLLLVDGLGPAVLRALALIAEVIYRDPPAYCDNVTHLVDEYDPFKFSFALGGKDGVPYPISRELYDEVLNVLERLISSKELNQGERSHVLEMYRRLRSFT
ncbi:MAG: DUF763 domain-containing protein [Thermoprotei archaeon]|nr:MAG: DUF763 domain-containing protein [Thermoprotei archaeon]